MLVATALLTLNGCGDGSHAAGTSAAALTGQPTQAAGTATSTSAAGATEGAKTSTTTSTTSASAARKQGAGHSPPHHPSKAAHLGTGGETHTATGSANASTGVPYEVHTTSMEPTYRGEAMVYYDPSKTHPQINDVVIFYLPTGAEEGSCAEVLVGGRPCREPVPGLTESVSIRRVVALAGETIAIRRGRVIRNGESVSEPPIVPCGKDEKVGCEFPTAITVPAGSYYLMADNRGLYRDSRIFGAVPQEAILGIVEGS